MVDEPLYYAFPSNCTCLLKNNLKQAENRLFLQVKLERILNILWAF